MYSLTWIEIEWYKNKVKYLFFFWDFSETNATETTVNGTAKVPISFAEYLKTKYDKTVRPNSGSGKKNCKNVRVRVSRKWYSKISCMGKLSPEVRS